MSLFNLFGNTNTLLSTNTIFIIGRVTHVVRGPYLQDGKTLDPDYNDPTDVGKIKYIITNSPQSDSVTGESNPPARPAWPHIIQIPLLGEYVYIIPGPGLDQTRGSQDYYYLPPFGLWRSPHHNALPNLDEVAAWVNSDHITSEQVMRGSANNPTTNPVPFPLAPDFPEKADVKALTQFTGDVTIEGRWGNSIRLGSSNSADGSQNGWSKSNDDGDPIIIISNGQGVQADNSGWTSAVENINTDQSSIYLTAGHQIVVNDIQNSFLLSSFGVTLNQTTAFVKPLTQTPTSNDGLSPQFQDSQIVS